MPARFQMFFMVPVHVLVVLLGWAAPGLTAEQADRSRQSPSRDSICQTTESCYRVVLDHIESGPSGTDLSEQGFQDLKRLLTVRASEPDVTWRFRAGLLAGILLKAREPDRSLQLLEEARPHFPILDDYLRLWRGEALVQQGEFPKAAKLFASIPREVPDSLLSDLAVLRGGEAWYRAGDCPTTIQQLRNVSLLRIKEDSVAALMVKLADCQIRTIQRTEGLETLKQVWIHFPLTPEAQEAAARLQTRMEGTKWIPESSDLFTRGKVLLQQAYYPEAIQAFRSFLDREPSHAWREKAWYFRALALSRLKRYDEAEGMFQDLVKGRGDQAGESAVWLAKIYLRTGRGQGLSRLPGLFGKISLSPAQKSTIMFYLGVWEEDHSRTEKAISAYRRAASFQPGSGIWMRAHWRMGWIHYRRGAFQKAVQSFDEIVQKNRPASAVPQFLFWMGKALEAVEDSRASEVYRRLCEDYPYTYYGQLAHACRQPRPVDRDVVSNGMSIPDAVQTGETLHDRVTGNSHFLKFQELQALGLHPEATRELVWVVRHGRHNRDTLLTLAEKLREVGAQYEALRLAKIYFRNQLEGGVPPSEPEFWNLAYPDGYLSIIRYFSQGLVDPYLVAAIIREESQYDQRALSPAGAIGLMQLMPATVKKLSGGRGNLNDFRDQLFDSQTNIRLGSLYLGMLVKQFSGNVIHAVAAYNAGPHVVARWIRRNGAANPEEFVELIPYRETRGYVKRVLRAYREYHRIHNGTCRADSLDRVC